MCRPDDLTSKPLVALLYVLVFQMICFNPLYTELHFLEVLLSDTLYDPYLHFCYQLALETSAKYSSIKSLRGHDLCHTHSLAFSRSLSE